MNLACIKPKDIGYTAEFWSISQLANHVRKKCEAAGHPCLNKAGKSTIHRILTTDLFLFNHSCKGTISVKIGHFTDLYNGPIFQESKFGSDECPGYYLQTNTLDSCQAQCECAFIREIIKRFSHFNGMVNRIIDHTSILKTVI